ncbi:hypothetical protein RHMOL_Rhmol06G0309100 [Rhododendron molle]|uniref:Uncharacterized protein n=1 Tax=Rhododendron molle TaxID=49168 RepID=A0ACC0NIX2_RHOML|nr:hypothetical protein RHMOL_Rhmol06G0309100 [Rhododendron molle]
MLTAKKKKINANPDHLEVQSLVSSSRGAITSFFIVSIVFQGKYQEAKQPYKHRTEHMATTFLRSEHCGFTTVEVGSPDSGTTVARKRSIRSEGEEWVRSRVDVLSLQAMENIHSRAASTGCHCKEDIGLLVKPTKKFRNGIQS